MGAVPNAKNYQSVKTHLGRWTVRTRDPSVRAARKFAETTCDRPAYRIGGPGVEVAIFDDQEQRVPDGRVGRIGVKGPSITKGYWESPELTANMIHGEWLDTGDLGFLHEGELYIAGRIKDLIIIRGRNYAPQEMEELLLDVEGVRKGCTAAVSTMVEGEGEQLIILAEKDPRSKRPEEEVIAEINHCILTGLSLKPRDVELLEPGTLPRTSSGKLRRSEALRQFLAGELVPP